MLRRFQWHSFAVLTAFWLAACSCSLLPPKPQTLGQKLVYAEETATAANTLAAKLVSARAIDVKQAEVEGAAADLVVATVRHARAQAQAGDAAGAAAQYEALAADLDQLKQFLQDHQSAP